MHRVKIEMIEESLEACTRNDCASCHTSQCRQTCIDELHELAAEAIQAYLDEVERQEEGCDHCNNGLGADNCLHAGKYVYCKDCYAFGCLGNSHAVICNDYESVNYCRYCGRKLVD